MLGGLLPVNFRGGAIAFGGVALAYQSGVKKPKIEILRQF